MSNGLCFYLIFIVLKFLRILNGKNKRIKFPNLWLLPILLILMIVEDYAKTLSFSLKEIVIIIICSIIGSRSGNNSWKNIKI